MKSISSSRRAVTKAVMGNWCKFGKSLLASRKLMLVPLMVTSILICLLLHGRYWSRGNHNNDQQRKLLPMSSKFQCCNLRQNLITILNSILRKFFCAKDHFCFCNSGREIWGCMETMYIYVYLCEVSSVDIHQCWLCFTHLCSHSSWLSRQKWILTPMLPVTDRLTGTMVNVLQSV